MERGVNQGEPVSPTILDIVLDTVVMSVMFEFCEIQEAHHGLGLAAGEQNSIL